MLYTIARKFIGYPGPDSLLANGPEGDAFIFETNFPSWYKIPLHSGSPKRRSYYSSGFQWKVSDEPKRNPSQTISGSSKSGDS